VHRAQYPDNADRHLIFLRVFLLWPKIDPTTNIQASRSVWALLQWAGFHVCPCVNRLLLYVSPVLLAGACFYCGRRVVLLCPRFDFGAPKSINRRSYCTSPLSLGRCVVLLLSSLPSVWFYCYKCVVLLWFACGFTVLGSPLSLTQLAFPAPLKIDQRY
jgi:hypothetical protein